MPGERTPRKVPMMPEADIVALSGSVSNQRSRNSAALIVMSPMKVACSRRGRPAKSLSKRAQGHRVTRVGPARVEGRHAQDGLDEAGHPGHEPPVLAVGLGIGDGPAAQLAHRVGAVVGAPEMIAIERRERAVQGQDVEAVPGQLQVADDLGSQQAHDVGEDAEAEAREDLLGQRGAAEDLATLEDERAQATAGEVGRADEAVMAAADDDGVVTLGHEPWSLVLGLGLDLGDATVAA